MTLPTPSASSAASAPPRRRARLPEYVPWILRDYATNQGPSTAIVVLLIAYLSLLPVFQGPGGASITLGNVPLDAARRLLPALLPPLVFLGAFFATNGIIANDRKLNHYRFLFAKPLNPLAYYSTIFATYGVGLLLVTVVLFGLWALVVRPLFPAEVLLIVPVMYLAYGGIGFLLSAAWRFDWLSLVTVFLVANVAWGIWGDATGAARYLLYLLPPVHRANGVYAVLAGDGVPWPWGSVLWLAGYGATCFLAGLVVLRKRPMGTS